MKNILRSILIILLISFSDVSAQESKLEKENYLSISLLPAIFSISPRWELGYMTKINERYNFRCQLGYGDYNSSIYRQGKISRDYVSWSVKPEILYKFIKKGKWTHYLSFDLFYINHKDIFYNDHFKTRDSHYIGYDKADYFREKAGFNLNLGTFVRFSKNFGCDFKTGLGLRRRSVRFSNIHNNDWQPQTISEGLPITFDEATRNEGTFKSLNISLQALLFYKFN